jgi:hypothetical protein
MEGEAKSKKSPSDFPVVRRIEETFEVEAVLEALGLRTNYSVDSTDSFWLLSEPKLATQPWQQVYPHAKSDGQSNG